MGARKPDADEGAADLPSRSRAEVFRRLERAGLERERAEEELLRDWYRVRAEAAPDADSLLRLQAQWEEFRRRMGLPHAQPPATT